MKAIKKSVPFLLAAFLLFQGMIAFAQDEKKTKVHLKVMKNDEITVDTTFQVASGADSDELKKAIQEITGIEDLDLHLYSSGDLHAHAIKMIKEDSDSLKRVAVYVGEGDDIKDVAIIKEDVFVSVSKVGVAKHQFIIQSEKGDEKVYAIVPGDEMDMDNVEEIVIKKKDGNVIIMKGDEIKTIKGDNIYLKTFVDDKGSFYIFPAEDDNGMVVVKKNVKVIKKEGDEGEEVIEITIMQSDKTKEKKVIKEKK